MTNFFPDGHFSDHAFGVTLLDSLGVNGHDKGQFQQIYAWIRDGKEEVRRIGTTI